MKYCFFGLLFFAQFAMNAQAACEYSQNITDSLGVYKSTREYIVHERNFGSTSSYLFFSLVQDNGVPMLSVQYIQKSGDFIKATCFNAASRLYLQLDNGKIVTLLYAKEDVCGTLVSLPEEQKSSRILSGNFVFIKGNMEDLEASPVNLVRIKFTTESVDFALKTNIVSELTKETYNPNTYFMRFLKCVK